MIIELSVLSSYINEQYSLNTHENISNFPVIVDLKSNKNKLNIKNIKSNQNRELNSITCKIFPKNSLLSFIKIFCLTLLGKWIEIPNSTNSRILLKTKQVSKVLQPKEEQSSLISTPSALSFDFILTQLDPKKAYLFENGQEIFKRKVKDPSQIETSKLDDTTKKEFKLDQKTSPQYFKDSFNKKSQQLSFSTTAEFFDYESTPEYIDYWIDFANASLGGGAFIHGFVQEEIMVAEMPDFAEYIAKNVTNFTNKALSNFGWCNISTRENNSTPSSHDPARDRVLAGSPTPLLIKGLHLVQTIDKTIYGKIFERTELKELKTKVQELSEPQKVNILAIAAPKLDKNNKIKEQCHINTLKDIFNTLVAGFTLVKKNHKSDLPIMIHSGKLGCGAFNNNKCAVYLLHRLAANYQGIHLKLHDYSEKDTKNFESDWQSISNIWESKDFTIEQCLKTIFTYLENKFTPSNQLNKQSICSIL